MESVTRRAIPGWWVLVLVILACLVAPTAAVTQEPSPSPAAVQPAASQVPVAAPGPPLDLDTACASESAGGPAPSGAPPVGTSTVTDSVGSSFDLISIPVGADPAGVAVDSGDTYGRVFTAIRGEGTVDVRYGRSPDLRSACRLPLPGIPVDVAVDGQTGIVLVTLAEGARVVLLDGRADPTRIVGWVDLPGDPGQVVIDEAGRRAWVTLPALGQVALLQADAADEEGRTWALVGTFDAGSFPTFVAADPDRQRLLVSAQGQAPDVEGDQRLGRILLFDTSVWPPAPIGEPIPAGVPTGALFDPVSGSAYALENGPDTLAWITFPTGGVPTAERVALPYGNATQQLNPVDLVLMPGGREVTVTMSAGEGGSSIGGHIDVFGIDEAGRPAFARSIPSASRTRGIAIDPRTGRLFVSDVTNGRLAAYDADEPSEPPPPPPTQIAEALPGPLEISIAPEDVVRTVGLSLLVLLLVGAPTPLFNETLESHLGVIQGFFTKRARTSRAWLSRVTASAQRFAGSIWGVAVYLLGAALLYSFLTPGFPGSDWPLVLALAMFSLVVATIVDILPGERYVRRKYQARGKFRVVLWTLVLAAATVFISRLANLSPGYMYGIIGTFAFAIPLSREDEGRMEARGALGLLLLALGSWFARIPFEPTAGVPLTGPLLIVNMALVGMFVVAVEGLVFGLIPISFMPGPKIFAWSKWRWALLWGAGLALFAHVLVYPVTLAQPSPDPASLTTTLISAGLYGALAIIFWLFFRRYDARIQGVEEAPAAEGVPGSEAVPDVERVPSEAVPAVAEPSEAVPDVERVAEPPAEGPPTPEPDASAPEPTAPPPAKRRSRKPPAAPGA
ncbi:MAG: FGLLP motif-containing membrane protein [Candidatus Limnocylindrales bacterium]